MRVRSLPQLCQHVLEQITYHLGLLVIILRENFEYVLNYITAKAEVETPLAVSIRENYPLDVIKERLEEDPEQVNVLNRKGQNVLAQVLLHSKGDEKQLDMLRFLTKKGCDIQQKTLMGNNLLSLGLKLKSSFEVIHYLLKSSLLPEIKDIVQCIENNDLRLLSLLLDYGCYLYIKSTFPSIISFLVMKTGLKFEGEVGYLLVLMVRLANEFEIDPNDESLYGIPFSHLLVFKNSNSYQYHDIIDHFLSIDRLTGNSDKHGSLLHFAIHAKDYLTAEKLIHRLSDVTKCSLTNLCVRPGFSYILMLCFYGGYAFPRKLDIFCRDENILDPESIWFEGWIEKKRKEVLSLVQMATIKVRTVHKQQSVAMIQKHLLYNSNKAEQVVRLTYVKWEFKRELGDHGDCIDSLYY